MKTLMQPDFTVLQSSRMDIYDKMRGAFSLRAITKNKKELFGNDSG